MPPEIEHEKDEKIQSEFSDELDLDKMFLGSVKSEDGMSDDVAVPQPAACVLFKNTTTTMNVKVENTRKRKSDTEMDDEEEEDDEEAERLKDLKHLGELPANHGRDLSNASSGKDLQKAMKKRRKAMKKSRKEMEGVGDDLSNMMSGMTGAANKD